MFILNKKALFFNQMIKPLIYLLLLFGEVDYIFWKTSSANNCQKNWTYNFI